MNPELLLVVVAAFAAFLLKTTFAFGICIVFDWLVDSPNRRFMIWLSFICGAAAYWLWLAKGALAVGKFSPGFSYGPARPAVSSFGTWQIPDSWSYPMGLALRVIGISYVLILSYTLFAHLRKQGKLRWILGFTTDPPADIIESFGSLAQSLHLGHARLLVLSGITSPATFGWIRPTVLLPDICLSHDRFELEDILRHELHHIRRKDFAWNALAMLSRSLIFFHPAAWYAIKRLQFDRELACDLAVVSHSPSRRATYAECLVRFARLNLAQDSHSWGIDFASSQHLKARIHSILAGAKIAPKWLICLRAAAGLTLLAGFIGISPSLAILLSYSHRQILQPSTADVLAPQTVMESRPGTRTTGRLQAISAPTSSDAAAAPISNGEGVPPRNTALAETETVHSSNALSSAGPGLLHRSTGTSSRPPKQETIELIDPSGAPDSKTGDQKVKQALQQSLATAAAIYKRSSDIDRH